MIGGHGSGSGILERVRHIFHRQAGVPNLSAEQFHDAIVIPICGILRTVDSAGQVNVEVARLYVWRWRALY
jgi:hypothetical protein